MWCQCRAICWFNKGVTDSWASKLNIIDCLNLIPGCCCPHYDGEKDRKSSVHQFIEKEIIHSCYAIEDGAALHFVNGKFVQNISFYANKKSFYISKKNNKIIEQPLKSIQI